MSIANLLDSTGSAVPAPPAHNTTLASGVGYSPPTVATISQTAPATAAPASTQAGGGLRYEQRKCRGCQQIKRRDEMPNHSFRSHCLACQARRLQPRRRQPPVSSDQAQRPAAGSSQVSDSGASSRPRAITHAARRAQTRWTANREREQALTLTAASLTAAQREAGMQALNQSRSGFEGPDRRYARPHLPSLRSSNPYPRYYCRPLAVACRPVAFEHTRSLRCCIILGSCNVVEKCN